MQIFKYPLDLRGTSVDNKVVNEIHVIGTRTNRTFAPDYGPVFGNSVVIRDLDNNNRQLVPTVDYDLLHLYREAEMRTGQAVYAAIRIKNPDVGTRLGLDAQYVGGEFSYSYYAILEAIRAIENDPRPIYWGELIGVPSQMPPTPHEHSIYNTYGWKTMVDAVADCTAAVREAGVANQRLLFQQMEQMRQETIDLTMMLGTLFEEAAQELSLL